MAHIEWFHTPDGKIEFSGSLTIQDYYDARLDPFERSVVNSPVASAADFLQSMEIIFRRLHQQRQSQGRVDSDTVQADDIAPSPATTTTS